MRFLPAVSFKNRSIFSFLQDLTCYFANILILQGPVPYSGNETLRIFEHFRYKALHLHILIYSLVFTPFVQRVVFYVTNKVCTFPLCKRYNENNRKWIHHENKMGVTMLQTGYPHFVTWVSITGVDYLFPIKLYRKFHSAPFFLA